MTIAPKVKLRIFGYGLILFSMVRVLGSERMRNGGLIWPWVLIWLMWIALMPAALRNTRMYPVWGWFCLIVCGLLIACGPIVPVQPISWMLYLLGVCLSGFGARTFLFDKDVEQYALSQCPGNELDGRDASGGDKARR